MVEVPGVSGGATSSSAPARSLRGESVRLSVPEVDDRTARAPRGAGPLRASADAASAKPPHVIRFEGRDLDPYAPRGTYLDITV